MTSWTTEICRRGSEFIARKNGERVLVVQWTRSHGGFVWTRVLDANPDYRPTSYARPPASAMRALSAFLVERTKKGKRK